MKAVLAQFVMLKSNKKAVKAELENLSKLCSLILTLKLCQDTLYVSLCHGFQLIIVAAITIPITITVSSLADEPKPLKKL